jgi:uncharacterized protein
MNITIDDRLIASHKYIATFRNKAVVLREIHSNLAQKCRTFDLWFTVLTIFLISSSSFLGFSGVETIHLVLMKSFFAKYIPELEIFKLAFNVGIFGIFFVSLLNLIFRWKENHTIHFQGVVRLTHFINWLDEQKILNTSFDEQLIKDISSKYAAIIDILPPNDAKDYLKAKQSLASKSTNKERIRCCKLAAFLKKFSPFSFRSNNINESIEGEAFFKELLNKSPLILPLLNCLRETDERFWLGGGLIRNYIWDSITGRSSPIQDIDVIYFDEENISAVTDANYEKELNKRAQVNLRWSVKNQVRMYEVNNEGKVNNLYEAIQNWPETATAIIVRLDECDNLQIIAPYGLQDLFSLNVKPTPFHKENRAAYDRRLTTKKWKERWPELNVTL